MITAKLSIKGRPTMLLGLSRKNTERLLDGQPIHKDIGFPIDVLIVGGETEETILEDLKKHFGPPDNIVSKGTN